MLAEYRKVKRGNRKIFGAWQIESHTKKYGKEWKIEICRRKAGTTVVEVKSRQETGGIFFMEDLLWQKRESSKCMKLQRNWKKA